MRNKHRLKKRNVGITAAAVALIMGLQSPITRTGTQKIY